MSTLYSCARPYAAAVFMVAQADDHLPHWHAFLQSLASIISDPKVTAELNNPEFSRDQLEMVLLAAIAYFPEIKEKAAHFIATLKANHRFMLLTEISKQFEMNLYQFNRTSLVQVTTAIPVSDDWLLKLEQVLIKKINCHQVIFECEIDETVLAGAVIKIGDRVMDGSVRNKLSRLLEFSLR